MRAALRGLVFAVHFGALWSGGVCSAEEYRLQPGDVMRFAVFGLPDLTSESAIDTDGVVSLPYLKSISAAGKTVFELEAEVGTSLSGSMHRYLRRDGTEDLISLSPEDIQITVAAYRPVMVYGAVARPGEVGYRAGLTVRGAFAIAGGVASPEVRGGASPEFSAALLRGEIAVLSARLDHQNSLVSRLREELAILRSGPPSDPSEAADAEGGASPGSPETRQRIAALNSRVGAWEGILEQIDERLASLKKREVIEAESLEEDNRDKERIDGLFQKGIVAAGRVSDVRHAQLLSATRLMQTQDAIVETGISRTEWELKILELALERQTQLVEQIGEAELEAAEAAARLDAARERLALLTIGEAATGEEEGLILAARVYRSAAGEIGSFVAELDRSLEPGDIVEFTLRREDAGCCAQVGSAPTR